MRSKIQAILSAVLCSLVTAATAQAASVSGIVSNKTSGKPSSGDLVELIDVQSGMSAVAKATSDSKGHYTLNEPANGPYLIRATHQGAGYFIAAPEGGKSGDIAVYDASPNVSGISVEADVLQMEAQNDQLVVSEHFFVHNISAPKVTKAGGNTFEFVLPSDATLDMSEATRPTGMPTIAQPKPTGTKGHYTFDVPIEPDQGEKDTIFEIQYHLPYKGKYTMHAQVTMPVDNFAVQLPRSMALKGESGSTFQPVQAQQQIQIYLLKNAQPGAPILFTVSGTGAMPRDQQGPQSGGDQGGQQAQGPQPGGGIGVPIADPDPLTKYKWWILGALGVLLAAAAAFLLRKPGGNTGAALPTSDFSSPVAAPIPAAASPAGKRESLLNALKEEMFSLESERLSGTIPAAEYAEQKAALEIVLKRALHRK